MKELDFPNTIEAWHVHSQNVMLCLISRVFVMNKYSNHRTMETHNNKHSSKYSYTDVSHKGNVKEDSTPCKKTVEMIMCSELLYLTDTFTETPNRKFDNTIFWSLLPDITTELSEPKIDINEANDSSDSEASLDNLSRSIFVLGQQKAVNDEIGTNIDDVDTSGLEQNIINVLEDTFFRIDLDTEATVEGEEKEIVTVGKNNAKTAKIKKMVVHPLP